MRRFEGCKRLQSPKPTMEEIRQLTLADQARGLKDARPPTRSRRTQTKTPRTPSTKFPAAARITLLVKTNPHRESSSDFKKFSKLYSTGKTIEAALAAGIDRGYLNYMVRRQLISVR